jgi:N-acetylated-alpha-linked acidic dipeptidase
LLNMTVKTSKLALLALLATGIDACQRERKLVHNGHMKRAATPRAPLTPDEALIISSFDSRSIDDWSYYYTHGAHLAGRNESQAQWTADHWSQWGISSSLATYNVYLDYPVSKSMLIMYPNGSIFQPELEEAKLEQDETTTWPNRIPTFHGYSANGEAAAEYVYVGRGQQVDYQRLGTTIFLKVAQC